VGRALVADRRMGLISATESCAMGREVGALVLGRLGRVLMELGGNNAKVVAPSADFDLASRAILFAAVGTAGQRCTTLRRLIVHDQCIRAKISAGVTGKPLKDPPSTYARPPKPGHSFSPQLHPLDRYYSSSNNTFAFFMSAASLSSTANNEKYASLVIR